MRADRASFDAPVDRRDPDASPFGYPDLMDGYPLDERESAVTARLLAEYRRRHDRGEPASAGEPPSAAEPHPA